MKKAIYVLITVIISTGITFSQTWTELTSGVTVSLNSVSASSQGSVWACGNSGTVIRTTNGGANWTSVGSAPISNTLALYNIFGIDSMNALVTGSTSTATFVYRTANGGTNWTQVFTQTPGFIDAIWMGNSQTGFMYGDPVGGRWSLWGTVTGGLTWDSAQFYLPQNGSEAGWNNAFYFDNIGQAVWFGTNNTRIYRSTNLILWSTEATTGQANSSALWFNNSTQGMMGGTGMMYTTNSGANWSATTAALPGSGNIIGISGVGDNWWVVRQAGIIYFSPDDGNSWSSQYTAPTGNYYDMTKSRNGAAVFYAVRDNGGISKGTGFVGINPVSYVIPKQYMLFQNFPNPFNPSTKIEFSIPAGNANVGTVQLKVYDILGREVATLVNESLNPGQYEISFDASNLASGSYFYRLTAGSFTDVKKMMVVK